MVSVTPARRVNPELVGRLMAPMSRSRGAVRAMAAVLPRVDRAVNRLTRGRATLFSAMLPMLVLVTTGRKTGQLRRTPLLYGAADGHFVVVASNFGFDGHAGWSANLLHLPAATAIVRGRRIPVTAELLAGQERQEAMDQMLRLWPAYAYYAEHSGREFRVFRLSPV